MIGPPARALLATVFVLLPAEAVRAQLGAAGSPGPASTDTTAVAVTAVAGDSTERWFSHREPVRIQLSRVPAPEEGRLVVFLGRTDVTSLTELRATTITYRPGNLPLPTGQTEFTVYQVGSGSDWREIGRFPVRILNRAGFQQLGLVPKVDLASSGELDQGGSLADGLPERGTFQDLTLNLGFQGSAARAGWTVRSQANAVGVTRDEERLRFAERGMAAPAMDLSDYLLELERGPVQATLGHTSFGENRHLISGYASRGVSGAVRLGQSARLSLAALNGSSVVGWSNPVGLNRSDHRILSAALGLELVPSSPGLVQLDATVLDGSVLPLAGYTQGVVNDAEEGRGVGVQVLLGDPGQRVRVGGGFTRASFINPQDTLLSQGSALVPVRETTRNARHLDASIQLIRGLALSPTVQATLGAAFRHERVDPLFRSVAAPTRADFEQNVYEATATVGQLAVQYAHGRSRDNLDELASILTTRTRNHNFTAALPLGAVFRAPATAWWWPLANLAYQVTRQSGDGVPENGGFSPSHVPDQLNRNATLTLSWQHASWNLAYRHDISRQDNRQPGRELADFRAWVHAVTIAMTPAEPLTLAVDLAEERQRSLEVDLLQSTRRLGVQADWRVLDHTQLQGYFAVTGSADMPRTQENQNTELRLEASQGFNVYRRPGDGTQARFFIRYAHSESSLAGPFIAPAPDQKLWSLATGLSLRLY